VQLVVEEDARFNPFDREAWAALNAAMEPAARELETGAQGGADLALPAAAGRLETVDGVVVCRLAGSAFDRVPDKIRAAVNAALPNAVAYRKRDFEADAMMRALCVRNGVALPPAAAAPTAAAAAAAAGPAAAPLRVLVICHAATAGAMRADLEAALAATGRVELTSDPAACATADKVPRRRPAARSAV